MSVTVPIQSIAVARLIKTLWPCSPPLEGLGVVLLPWRRVHHPVRLSGEGNFSQNRNRICPNHMDNCYIAIAWSILRRFPSS